MKRVHQRNFFASISFGVIAGLFTIFNLNLDNMIIYIFLKLISVGLVPLTLCFSWVWLWRDSKEPFKFLGAWNSVILLLFLILNVLRIQMMRLGAFGVAYALLSLFLAVSSFSDWSHSKYGSFITGGLILLNVVFAFGMVMTTFNYMHPYFTTGGVHYVELGTFVTEISAMGALLTASSQLYWHEILVKRREEMIIEQLFADMDG